MKFSLLLSVCALYAGGALAQTAGPGAIPGALPVVPPAAASGGSPRAHRRTEKVPGMSRSDRKQLRKMSKVNAKPEGSTKPD